ncbi:MAG: DUF177 domain-containing protein [Armatimonadota bacterium]|nr:DUF177 domain-containing protein [Armatimonadota bacterium]
MRSLRAERGAVLVVECHEPVASGLVDLPFSEPVAGRLTLTNVGAVLQVEGRVRTAVVLTCDRCAVPFVHRLNAVVHEELAWASLVGIDEAREDEDRYLLRAGDNVWLDVEALIRDALVLALPMVARCGPDCRGLCPGCGADLGREPCRCAREDDTVDPRLARLAEWRGHRSESGPAS